MPDSGHESTPSTPALADLERTVDFILEAREWTLVEHWTYNPSVDQQRFIRIAADLWARFIDHCDAIVRLLKAGLVDSAEVLDRVAYEGSIHLLYLLRPYEDRLRKALLYETRMLLEVIETLEPEQGMDETRKRLEQIPEAIRSHVEKDRERRGTQWAGMPLWKMAEEVGIEGHRGYFTAVSWSVHSVVAGDEIVLGRARDRSGRVLIVPRKIDLAGDIEVTARHVDMMLRRVYREIRMGFYLIAPGIPGPQAPLKSR